jgi:MYXO-CTERM domain-containing protein
VTFTNVAANSVANNGLFWQVGSTTVLGANTAFEGNVLSGTTFSFGAAVTINEGRALTGTGQTITLDGNTINFSSAGSGYSGGLMFVDSGSTIGAIPEPTTDALLAALAALAVAAWRRQRAAK